MVIYGHFGDILVSEAGRMPDFVILSVAKELSMRSLSDPLLRSGRQSLAE
jgi:hypothetical protein